MPDGTQYETFPKRWTFSVRLEGEDTFFPCSAFALTEQAAKDQINGRYKDKVAEFKPTKPLASD